MISMKRINMVLTIIILSGITVYSQTPTISPPVSTDGLVLYLTADNYDFIDQSGHGQSVTGVNVQFRPTPWEGQAYYFNGNAYLEIPDIDNSLDIYGDYTLEMMVLPLYKEFGGVFYKGENSYANYSICYAHFKGNQGWQENYGGSTGGSGKMFFGKWTKITFIKKDGLVKRQN